MLSNYPVNPALPAADLARAKQFYADKLGLTPETEAPEGLTYRAGNNTTFLLFPSSGASSGTHTQMGWTVPDIEAEVSDLKARGLLFEEYDSPPYKTVNSILDAGPARTAWFKDSEGNLLAIIQYA